MWLIEISTLKLKSVRRYKLMKWFFSFSSLFSSDIFSSSFLKAFSSLIVLLEFAFVTFVGSKSVIQYELLDEVELVNDDGLSWAYSLSFLSSFPPFFSPFLYFCFSYPSTFFSRATTFFSLTDLLYIDPFER